MSADIDPTREELLEKFRQTEVTLKYLLDRVESLAEDIAKLQQETPRPESSKQQQHKININNIINAIIAWNIKQAQSNCQLRISIPIIKSLALAMRSTNQQAIQSVISSRSEELELHHLSLKIGERHNRQVQTPWILRSIARDILKLNNWEQVH